MCLTNRRCACPTVHHQCASVSRPYFPTTSHPMHQPDHPQQRSSLRAALRHDCHAGGAIPLPQSCSIAGQHGDPVGVVPSRHIHARMGEHPGEQMVSSGYFWLFTPEEDVRSHAMLRGGCSHCHDMRALSPAACDDVAHATLQELGPQAVELASLVAADVGMGEIVP